MPTRKFSDAAKSALLFILICLAVEACSERVRNSGGRTVAESEETAVIWGMPGELVKAGGAGIVAPLGRIADQLLAWTA